MALFEPPDKAQIVRIFNALRKDGWEAKSENNTEGPGLTANKDDKIYLSIKTIDGGGEAFLSVRPIRLG